jgi:hypothetical protein
MPMTTPDLHVPEFCGYRLMNKSRFWFGATSWAIISRGHCLIERSGGPVRGRLRG